MWYVNGIPVMSGNINWEYKKGRDEEEGVKVSIHLISLSKPHQRRQAIKAVERILEEDDVPWITPEHREWTLDLDKLKEFIPDPDFSSMDWFKGKISLEPEFETEERVVLNKPQYRARIDFYIVPEALRRTVMPLEPPIEIQESLTRFKEDYPDTNKVAFIMMKFSKTKAHDEIVDAIRSVLKSHGIVGVRADDKQYHDDLFYNIMTYMHGCGFGIAVFERIEAEEFNPNVSLEVGYMLALT